MRIRNQLSVVLLLLSLAFLTLGVAVGPQKDQKDEKSTAQRRVEEVIQELPLAQVNAPLPLDPKERGRREARGKKYNQGLPRIAPGVESTEVYHWPPHFPALPVLESDAIIVGQVLNAKAYLSTDRTSVYSEFRVTVESPLKNSSSHLIDSGSQLIVERLGGRVQYPSGQISSVSVAGFGVPKIGSRYLLFLKSNRQDDSYSLLTGYELRLGRVYALDTSTSSETNFSIYDNAVEAQVLKDLQRTLMNVRPTVP